MKLVLINIYKKRSYWTRAAQICVDFKWNKDHRQIIAHWYNFSQKCLGKLVLVKNFPIILKTLRKSFALFLKIFRKNCAVEKCVTNLLKPFSLTEEQIYIHGKIVFPYPPKFQMGTYKVVKSRQNYGLKCPYMWIVNTHSDIRYIFMNLKTFIKLVTAAGKIFSIVIFNEQNSREKLARAVDVDESLAAKKISPSRAYCAGHVNTLFLGESSVRVSLVVPNWANQRHVLPMLHCRFVIKRKRGRHSQKRRWKEAHRANSWKKSWQLIRSQEAS